MAVCLESVKHGSVSGGLEAWQCLEVLRLGCEAREVLRLGCEAREVLRHGLARS